MREDFKRFNPDCCVDCEHMHYCEAKICPICDGSMTFRAFMERVHPDPRDEEWNKFIKESGL